MNVKQNATAWVIINGLLAIESCVMVGNYLLGGSALSNNPLETAGLQAVTLGLIAACSVTIVVSYLGHLHYGYNVSLGLLWIVIGINAIGVVHAGLSTTAPVFKIATVMFSSGLVLLAAWLVRSFAKHKEELTAIL
jgi:hypothetical protein